ncbi:MAG TPA: DotU family type IV/VI secretion system protein [Deltaproteobacteria bacterium]|nr:DotU family type IV/VI secretion system protein [Deltaproteobacteria bacterium]HQI82290.1 DotU family type IV/VI secretion system protein [Deltaproteobacteria bacterium]
MHLSDAFMDTVAFVVYFLRTAAKRPLPYDQVRSRILELLASSADTASEFPPGDYDAARFAVCAWVDEAVMNSEWADRFTWQKEPLQLKFYQTTNAGELFFERLNALAAHQNDVREVYYLCLAMGFTGRFIREEDRFLLEGLKTSNLKVLTGASVGIPSLKRGELFPEAYPAERQASTPRSLAPRMNLMSILLAAFPVALFGVLFLIYSFVLGNVSRSLFMTQP